jgi:hypothetical protein
MSTNRRLFTFKDVDIYQHHADFFQPGQWLDDTCINLCFRCFENDSPVLENKVLLLDPAVVSFLRMQVDDEEEFEELLQGQHLLDHNWVFFPISDSGSFEQRGTHWSVVLLHVPTISFFYFDSCGEYSKKSAKQFVKKFTTFLKR